MVAAGCCRSLFRIKRRVRSDWYSHDKGCMTSRAVASTTARTWLRIVIVVIVVTLSWSVDRSHIVIVKTLPLLGLPTLLARNLSRFIIDQALLVLLSLLLVCQASRRT